MSTKQQAKDDRSVLHYRARTVKKHKSSTPSTDNPRQAGVPKDLQTTICPKNENQRQLPLVQQVQEFVSNRHLQFIDGMRGPENFLNADDTIDEEMDGQNTKNPFHRQPTCYAASLESRTRRSPWAILDQEPQEKKTNLERAAEPDRSCNNSDLG